MIKSPVLYEKLWGVLRPWDKHRRPTQNIVFSCRTTDDSGEKRLKSVRSNVAIYVRYLVEMRS
jgi:hypothetical protein